MKLWTKEEFFLNNRWFHATTKYGAARIIREGVKVKVNKNNPLDFGYGFYMTPDYDWAQKYLNETLLIDVENSEKDNGVNGIVFEFGIQPSVYAKGSNVKFFSKLDNEFAKFVVKNRIDYSKHIFTKCVHNYDMVGGPMSDGNQDDAINSYFQGRITLGELYEQILIPKESWQLLIHRQYIANELRWVRLFNEKGDEVNADEIAG